MSRFNSVSISASQALFTFFFLLFFFTVLNGYLLNLVSGYRANALLVTMGVLVELIVVGIFARGRISIQRDPLELAGFMIVVVGVWFYFIAASLPTLLPPTQSEDAVRVYLQVLFSYPEGKLVSWYPAGGAFLAAMFSHWLGWVPLRVLHPTAASFIALSAGAVYGMTCALLPRKRMSKIIALLAPALLFVPWSYFAGIIDWEQYFYAQAFAHFFVLAALWYIASYSAKPNWIFAALIGVALLGVVAAYPVLVALPLAVFTLMALAQTFPRLQEGGSKGALVTLGIFVALMGIAAITLQFGGILEFKAGEIAKTLEVGAGGVTNPSLENLGGPIFLMLTLVGLPIAWRAGIFGRMIFAFLLAWIFQYIALLFLQPYFQISGYRVDKTFYILVFPLAILAALLPARILDRLSTRIEASSRASAAAWLGLVLVLGAGVALFRPPKSFSPFTESELQTALWAKGHLDTYQISYLDPMAIRAYWLAFGLWRETLPNEWFQWIPAGTKLGPGSFEEWLRDSAWPKWILVRDVEASDRVPLQTVYRFGDSAILQKELPAAPAPTPAHFSRWHFGSTLKLIGYDLPRSAYSPGASITLTTYTESIYPPPATVGWRVELVDRNDAAVKVEGDPFSSKYPVQRWPPGSIARDIWTLPLDARAAPGVYELRMGLFRRVDGEAIEVRPASSEEVTVKALSAAPLAKIKIPIPAPSADELRAASPLQARVGENFSLLSYALQVDRSARRVHLTLYWQGISKTENDYTVFVHLLDASGKVVEQRDQLPLGGIYPTSIWDAQEIIKDDYALAIPADASLPLSIEIGMYAQPDLKRLPIFDSAGAAAGDHIGLPNVIQ